MAAATPKNFVLIYGGRGALGSVVIDFFKKNGLSVISVDLVANEEADSNVVLDAADSFSTQASRVMAEVGSILAGRKLKAVLCVAGGWAGGNAAADDLVRSTELMWKQSVCTSIISSQVASKFLEEGSVLCLTGAVPALGGTPGMIGYGCAKAAVHQLVKSLAMDSSGLPPNTTALAILPITLDTPQNRKFMPGADTSTWTPLETVAELLFDWVNNKSRPKTGSLVQIVTQNNETSVVIE